MDQYKFETVLPGNLTWPEGSTGFFTSQEGNHFLVNNERVFVDNEKYENSDHSHEKYWPRYALCMPAVPINSRLKSEQGSEYKMYEVSNKFNYPFRGVMAHNNETGCTRTLFGLVFNNDRRIQDENWVEVTHIGDGPVLPLLHFETHWETLSPWPGQANREALENCYKRIHGE